MIRKLVLKAKKRFMRKRKTSIRPDEPDKLSLDQAKNRWEVQKILAASDRAKAHAKADYVDSPASQSISLNTFRSFKKFKLKQEKPPDRLHYATSVLVLHMNDEESNEEKKRKKKKKKARKVNGWYVMGDDERANTRSPLSWKDILEQSIRDPSMYSEYVRNPTSAIMPSRTHRRRAEEQLDEECDPKTYKKNWTFHR